VSATGQLIQNARKAKGLTQTQLAEALGVTQPAVSEWESGISAPESFRVLRLATVLSISADWILEAIAADVEATPLEVMPESPTEGQAKRGRER
jgi:transcriptional regulator with XRE-family HTH domain